MTGKYGTTSKHPADQGNTLLGPKGSDAARLASIFKAGSDKGSAYKIPSPEEVTAEGKDLLQSAIVNDAGHTFGTFDRDYGHPDNPDLAEVKTGPGGLPAHAQAPNVSPPGPGSLNPADMPEPVPVVKPGGSPFPRGDGSLSPKQTSAEVAKQTLGELIKGNSFKGSDIGT